MDAEFCIRKTDQGKMPLELPAVKVSGVCRVNTEKHFELMGPMVTFCVSLASNMTQLFSGKSKLFLL